MTFWQSRAAVARVAHNHEVGGSIPPSATTLREGLVLDAGYLRGIVEPWASWARGAWMDGHQDPDEFAALVSQEYARPIDPYNCRRGYRRVVGGLLHFTEVPGRGASKSTWTEW